MKGKNNETAEEKFKRLAAARTNAVLDTLRILGKTANRQVYQYTEEDVKKVFSAIKRMVRETEAKFELSEKEEKFKL